jgi:predicted site-specific integrase-resolvase
MKETNNTFESRILTESETAKRLGIARSTLRAVRTRGEIGYFQISPNRLGYAPRHIDNYLKRCEHFARGAE